MIYTYNLIIITWSSVTARLRNSHSLYLHTPGVTTRKPLPAVIQIRVVSCPGAHFSIYQSMVTVLFNTTLPWEQSVVHKYDYYYNYCRQMTPLPEGYLLLQVMVSLRASSVRYFFCYNKIVNLNDKFSLLYFLSPQFKYSVILSLILLIHSRLQWHLFIMLFSTTTW